MKNRRRSLLLFFVFTVLGGFNLWGLLDRPFFANILGNAGIPAPMGGGDFVRMIGTVVMFGLSILCLKEYFFGRRSS